MQNDENLNQGRRRRQILVVDDEPAVCEAIKMLLEYDGYAVQTVDSGKEALSLLEQGSFDVVITDYSMSEMKGDKLAAAIKQLRPHLPVIMITAHADVLKASGNPLTGVDVLIDKPFLVEDLREGIFMALPATEIFDEKTLKPGHRRDDVGGL